MLGCLRSDFVLARLSPFVKHEQPRQKVVFPRDFIGNNEGSTTLCQGKSKGWRKRRTSPHSEKKKAKLSKSH